jgi:hypothetical protein
MKIRSILAVAFLGAATTAFAESTAPVRSTNFYVDASVVGAFPGEGLGDAVGARLAGGVSFHQVHSIEAEVIHFQSSVRYGGNIKFTPVLVTYKYSIPLVPKLSVAAGASVGFVHEVGHRSGWSWTTDNSDNALAIGLSADLSYAINESVALTAGVRRLQLQDTDYTTAGGLMMVSGGVSFRF